MFNKIHLFVAAVALAGALGLASSGAAAQAVDDDTTTHQVLARLDQGTGLRVDQIHVQTIDGVVYLHGLVDTPVEAEQAETLAHGVPNVRQVVNELEAQND